MKNAIKIVICGIMSALMMSACGKEEQNVEFTSGTVTEYVMQDGDSTIIGEVVSIIGNEVTIDVGSISEETKDMPPKNDEVITSAADENEDVGSETSEAKLQGNKEIPEMGGEIPDMSGEIPDMSGERPNTDEEIPDMGRERPGNSVEVIKTGETESYIIPVGMSVTGGSGRSSDYNAITAGAAIQITLNSEGLVVACEIL